MSTKTPEQQAAEAAHLALIQQLDMHSIHKSFRRSTYKPNQRRNKNIKTILGEATRKEASSSVAATPLPQDNSGAATPAVQGDNDDGLSTSGTSTPAVPSTTNGVANGAASNLQPNLAQASRSLSKLVLEKSLNGRTSSSTNGGLAVAGGAAAGSGVSSAPSATYTNIESAPSLAHSRRYCDVTGLPAPYTDPKTRMRYHNSEVFSMIRSLPAGVAEQFLEARGAHTVLK
jgi:INO80 complex subunit C